MARPPRIPNWLPDEQATLYFVTFCVAHRAKVLAHQEVFQKLQNTCDQIKDWWVLSAVVMPDHVHMVLAPKCRDASVKNVVAGMKRGMLQASPDWKWQEGCFDRLLRTDESAQQKWEYMRENPVRAGLVKSWEQWPYRIENTSKL